MARVFTMVNAISFLWLKGWHAPAGRRIREPRPLPRPGGSDRAAPVGARNLGPGRQIVSQDSPSGVSRFGGQAGTQASDATPPPGKTGGSRAGSITHILPADYASRGPGGGACEVASRSPGSA